LNSFAGRRDLTGMRPMLHVAGLAAILAGGTAAAQQTVRASVASSGAQGDGGVRPGVAISADGRFVAFASDASNLVPGDVNGTTDVFVHDLSTGATVRISVGEGGDPAGPSGYAGVAISADGRFVAFDSQAPNLVAGDANGQRDVFVRDRDADGNGVFDEPGGSRTVRVSVSSSGVEADGDSQHPAISADGRFVAFTSNASVLSSPNPRRIYQVYLRDRDADGNGRFDEPGDTTTNASLSSFGQRGDGSSTDPTISANGRFVGFRTEATNLFPGDTNGVSDVAVHDRVTGATVRISESASGIGGNSYSYPPASLSADGRFVAFASIASNLVPGDASTADAFVRDRDADGNGVFDEPGGVSVELASVDSQGVQGNGWTTVPALSLDGRRVAFESAASNLVAGDTNHNYDVFVHDRAGGRTERASVDTAGRESHAQSNSSSVAISGDGRFVAFLSNANDLVAGDTNGVADVFVRDTLPLIASAVAPAAGSEAGGEIARVRGVGFVGDAISVRFGGALADVLDVAPETITVKTPAGRGTVDVIVQVGAGVSTLHSGYEYVPAEIASRWGTVNTGAGDRADVLLVNALVGDARTREIAVAAGAPVQAVMVSPPSRPTARFVLYGWGRAPNAATVTALPLGAGALACPPPFSGGVPPLVWNNAGHRRVLGVPTSPSQPAPSIVFRSQRATPILLTLQGLVEDDGSPSPSGWSATNAIVLRVN
jgi:Tol biopolymer transport system component